MPHGDHHDHHHGHDHSHLGRAGNESRVAWAFGLTALFMAWALFLSWKRGTKLVDADRIYSMKEKLELLPKLLPFIVVIVGRRT